MKDGIIRRAVRNGLFVAAAMGIAICIPSMADSSTESTAQNHRSVTVTHSVTADRA
ncbi:hypothetical protein ABZ837_22395 [Streptomyces sp. NPDC047197]|uniref:hypothetical protein n=1 Tax=Streptomyces sp. NPDC047197 TaxID=3155477 RepID=UPI00340D253C